MALYLLILQEKNQAGGHIYAVMQIVFRPQEKAEKLKEPFSVLFLMKNELATEDD
jgi:hypothetical protein